MVVVGYGQIIPQAIIDIAPLGIINVHASLLPELRGAAPIQWAIARGLRGTGVTTMRIDAGLDTGDMSAALGNTDRTGRNRRRTFRAPRRSGSGPAGQHPGRACRGTNPAANHRTSARHLRAHNKKGRRSHRLEQSAQQIHNLIRGFQPWPGAQTSFRGQSLHLWRSRLVPQRWTLPARSAGS